MRLPDWHLHPDVLLALAAPALLYWRACVRRARDTGEAPTRRQVVLFSLGLGTLLVGAYWPVHDLAEEYLYSAHMVQHMLFTFVAPPLLIAGMPAWMMRSLLRPRWLAGTVRVLTKPLVALALFNGLLLLTHWPAVVDLSLRSEPVHLLVHLVIVGAALVVWWPVMSPLPEMPSLSPPSQMAYLFAQSLVPTVPASFLTFGRTPLYPIYATFPRIWGVSALTDQLIAGLIMKLGGGAILWGMITVIFFRWFAREQAGGVETGNEKIVTAT